MLSIKQGTEKSNMDADKNREIIIRKICEPEVIYAACLASGVMDGKKLAKIQQFQHTNKPYLVQLMENWQEKHDYVGVYRISCIGNKKEVSKWVKERIRTSYEKDYFVWLNELPVDYYK